jgi:hypothetical protein
VAEIERVRTEDAHRSEGRRAVALEDAEGVAIDVFFMPNADFDLASLEDARARLEILAVSTRDHCRRMGAILLAEYPDLWPETIRALLVHSCRCTCASEMADEPIGSVTPPSRRDLQAVD